MPWWLLLCLLLAAPALARTLQGSWLLAGTRGKPLSDQPVVLQVSEYVFKGAQINQKLSFRGCEEMLLQATVEDNQIFINANSYRSQPLPPANCAQGNPNDLIFTLLGSVFSFSIRNDTLLLQDPLARPLLTFTRSPPPRPLPDLAAIWTITQYANKTTTLSTQISSSQIYLCQGYSLYNYTHYPNSSIKLTPVSLNCPSQDLTKAISAVRYYRYRNGYLTLYDETVTPALQLVYASAYDPNNPLYSAPVTPTPPSPSATTPSPAITTPPVVVAAAISASNINGNWSIVSLFKIPMGKVSYFLLFNGKSLRLGGGCNTYDYDYVLNSSTQLITIQNGTSTKKACSQSDDQLYVSGVTKMYKYLLSTTNGVNTLMFYDQKANPTYTLTLSNNPTPTPIPTINPNALRPSQASSPNPNLTAKNAPVAKAISSIQSVVNAFQPGTYLMLLLRRRDLPRTIVKMTNSTFTYNLCDNIKQTYQLGKANSTIKIEGGPLNNRNCSKSEDAVYYSTLNQATKYSFDAEVGVIIFSNSDSELVTFTKS